MELAGAAAVVTGGGTGVGRAISLALADRGCSVIVNFSRSRDEAESTAAEARERGVSAVAWQADVAEDAQCRGLIGAAEHELGRLDVLVNNAGTTVFVPHHQLEDLTDDDWQRIFAVNTLGPFHCARAAKPVMDRTGKGHVINISSVAGVAGTGSSIPYAASKAALNNLTITLARVCGPSIQVNAVAPGFITGRWLRAGLGDELYDAVKENYEATTPLRAVCNPEDVRDAVMSLLTGSDLVTGQLLVVDGGMLIRQ